MQRLAQVLLEETQLHAPPTHAPPISRCDLVICKLSSLHYFPRSKQGLCSLLGECDPIICHSNARILEHLRILSHKADY